MPVRSLSLASKSKTHCFPPLANCRSSSISGLKPSLMRPPSVSDNGGSVTRVFLIAETASGMSSMAEAFFLRSSDEQVRKSSLRRETASSEEARFVRSRALHDL